MTSLERRLGMFQAWLPGGSICVALLPSTDKRLLLLQERSSTPSPVWTTTAGESGAAGSHLALEIICSVCACSEGNYQYPSLLTGELLFNFTLTIKEKTSIT